jgi:hypothetical protein
MSPGTERSYTIHIQTKTAPPLISTYFLSGFPAVAPAATSIGHFFPFTEKFTASPATTGFFSSVFLSILKPEKESLRANPAYGLFIIPLREAKGKSGGFSRFTDITAKKAIS